MTSSFARMLLAAYSAAILLIISPSLYAQELADTSWSQEELVTDYELEMQKAKTEVIYIGGHGTTQSQMQQFAAAANQVLNTDPVSDGKFRISTSPYPSRQPDRASAVRDGAQLIRAWTDEINQNSDTRYVLVGHSSGSAITIEIAKRVVNPTRVALVILDGFKPGSVATRVPVQCWSAVSSSPKLKSLNYSAMSTCSNFRQIKYSGCDNQMCLHFALVNQLTARAKVNASNYKRSGYNPLHPELEWLKPFLH